MTQTHQTKTTETQDQATLKSVTAEDLLSLRNQPPTESFEVPGLGPVRVQGLSNLEAHQWRNNCRLDERGRISDEYADAKLIVRCLRDAEGRRILTDKHLTQIVELPELIVSQLVALCMKFCGIGAQADGQILKNYVATVAGSS